MTEKTHIKLLRGNSFSYRVSLYEIMASYNDDRWREMAQEKLLAEIRREMPMCADCRGVTFRQTTSKPGSFIETTFVTTCEVPKFCCPAEVVAATEVSNVGFAIATSSSIPSMFGDGSFPKIIEETWNKRDAWLKDVPVGNFATGGASPEIQKSKDIPKTDEDFW